VSANVDAAFAVALTTLVDEFYHDSKGPYVV
jgi:hypothetical protein